MTLRTIAAEPAMLIVGDTVWRLEIAANGHTRIVLAGGSVHECDLAKVARLMIEARRMAMAHFGKGFEQ